MKLYYDDPPHACTLPSSRRGEPAVSATHHGRPVATKAMVGTLAHCECGQWWECRSEVYVGEIVGVWYRISRRRGERLYWKWAKKHHGE